MSSLSPANLTNIGVVVAGEIPVKPGEKRTFVALKLKGGSSITFQKVQPKKADFQILQAVEEQSVMSVVVTGTGVDLCPDEGITWTKYRSICEIEEEEENYGEFLDQIKHIDPLPSIKEESGSGDTSPFSLCYHDGGGDVDVVYVAVGKTGSSMDALLWSLNHAVVNASTPVCLIHVYPEIRYIPTPRKLPVSQVNQEQKGIYTIQEKSKRRVFLQKFLDVCSAAKITVDTVLIESDMEAKTLLDLIPILNITKLVLGTTKSSLRKLRSRRGNEIAGKVLQNAPEFCEVKIICEGKEVELEKETSPVMPTVGITHLGEHQGEDRKVKGRLGFQCHFWVSVLRFGEKKAGERSTWFGLHKKAGCRKEAQCKLAGHNKRGCFAEAESLGKTFDKSVANDIEKGKVEV
ncbi:hypothetical protein RHSIM_Rhsim13G0139800 [Rhododendron simsii]|uniref:Uncharacterized protein n=1 Tax=Rhododendron simsii TaxID=118357 RepID=A0A834L7G5_RHOSS|nr:hypothetical protein RHSIM_Rhsim13G0139800 [Rhododendron simsii]